MGTGQLLGHRQSTWCYMLILLRHLLMSDSEHSLLTEAPHSVSEWEESDALEEELEEEQEEEEKEDEQEEDEIGEEGESPAKKVKMFDLYDQLQII